MAKTEKMRSMVFDAVPPLAKTAISMADAGYFLLLGLFLLQLLSPASASESYLIDCGSNVSTASGNRLFAPDSNSDSLSLSAASTLSLEYDNPPKGLAPFYRTARIFEQPASYRLKIREKGAHIIRLHFFAFASQNYRSFLPFSSLNYDLSSAVFDVSSLGSPLLEDFQVDDGEEIREFIINIDAEAFDISFTPSSKNSPNPFAFINAIEVYSVSTNFISSSVKFLTSGGSKLFDGMPQRRLEVVRRVNVGGPNLTASNDTLGREWIADDEFLLVEDSGKPFLYNDTITYRPGSGLSTAEIAPATVYSTAREMANLNLMFQEFNITWIFEVTPNRPYLVRMHFCDIISKLPGELYFSVFINGQFAEKDLQPGSVTNQTLATPFYRDFIAEPTNNGRIHVSVGVSDMSPSLSKRNAILNGVEIMGVSNSKHHSKKKLLLILIPSVIGGCFCIGLLVLAMLMLAKRRRQQLTPEEAPTTWAPVTPDRRSSQSVGTNLTNGSLSPNANLGLQISFADLKVATNNFDERFVIGSGGFGKVYKGVLRDGTKVAVKRAVPGSRQGLSEFQAEIIILSRIRHRHLVSLVGYCEEESEMILVYEFIEKGTLKKHLCGPDSPCLSWEQRLEICIGAARGLHYLHTGSSQAIIHRDVKSSNILLDEDNLAKVADFGLSKIGPTFSQTHVSTAVKGSFGYLDPEYYKRHQLTEKSDVYSFGVVLLEVLCGRPVIDSTLPSEAQNLAEWAMKWQKKGAIEKVVDAQIRVQINSNSLRKFGETAERCLADYGVDRPTMGDVLWNLEYVLRLQQTAINREPHEDSNADAKELEMPTISNAPSTSVTAQPRSNQETYVSTSQVFSQLITNEGR